MKDIKIFEDNLIKLDYENEMWVVSSKYTKGLCYTSSVYSYALEVYEMLVRQYISLIELKGK